MNLIFRFLIVLIRARFRPKLEPMEESVVRFRVLPNDIDFNLHMNNGRYLTLMDLGRLDYVARIGLLRIMLKNKWAPVVATVAMRYRVSLKPFERYTLHTSVVCWDEKWVYMEQRFMRGDKLAAQAYVKCVFSTGKRTIRPREIIAAAGRELRSPHMPPAIEALKLAEGLAGEKPGRA